jgi:hypothetical protein
MNLRLAKPFILDKAALNESSTNVDKSIPRAWQNLRMGTISEFMMYVAGPDKILYFQKSFRVTYAIRSNVRLFIIFLSLKNHNSKNVHHCQPSARIELLNYINMTDIAVIYIFFNLCTDGFYAIFIDKKHGKEKH